jgi:PAS domain S-box-containing protein
MTDDRPEVVPNSREAEETLDAIRRGAVDAFVIEDPEGHRIYTLEGADLPYSILVGKMQQGAAMLNERGEMIYCNPSLAQLANRTRESMIGLPLERFIDSSDQSSIRNLAQRAQLGASQGDVSLLRVDGARIPVSLSFRLLSSDKSAIGVLVTDLTAQKQQADLAMRLQYVQDEERRRLARDLHDSVGQLLVAMAINMSRVESEAHKLSPEIAKVLSENAGIVLEINDQIRTISHLLHPVLLDDIGLPAALQWYIDGFAERSKIQTSVEIAEDFGRLPKEIEIAVFRAVQECLTNIHRHSGTSTCFIKLTRDERQLQLEVGDNGCGIPESKLMNLASSGVGLRGMQERFRQLGGTLEIHSSDKGTIVKAVLPVILPAATSAGDQVARVSGSE